MIGVLTISERTRAVLHDDGRWECAHKGYEGELNTAFKPRSTGIAAVLPFGVAALTAAASAYRCDYKLAHKLPPAQEVRKAQEAAREAKSLSPFHARVKSLKELIHRKAMEERRNKRGHRYCIETTTGRRTPCPPKAGESPLKGDSAQKPVTPTTPERIVSGDTPTSGKVRKRGNESVKAPDQTKQPKAQAAPEQKTRPTNPQFADTNLMMSMLESAREGDPSGLAALADWQTEKYGDDPDAKPFPAAAANVYHDDPRTTKLVANSMLDARAHELVSEGMEQVAQYAEGKNPPERMRSALAAGLLVLRWDDPRQYELGQTLLARGWHPGVIKWKGTGAPKKVPAPTLSSIHSAGLLHEYVPVHVPEGDVPMAIREVPNTSGDGPSRRFNFGQHHTNVGPNPETLKKYQESIKRAIRAAQAKARPNINPRAHIVPTTNLVAEIRKSHPEATMTEIWGAVHEMAKQGYVAFQHLPDLGPEDPTNRVAHGETADNGILWRMGRPTALNIHPEWAQSLRQFMSS